MYILLISFFCFEQMFYIDRVIHYNRLAPRVFPVIKGWDSTKIRIRQGKEIASGGFGKGPIECRLEVADLRYEIKREAKQSDRVVIDKDHNEPIGTSRDAASVNPPAMDDAQSASNSLISAAIKVANAMTNLLNHMKKIPHHLQSEDCVRLVVDRSRQLMGFRNMQFVGQKTSNTQDNVHGDCTNPLLDASLKQIMEVIKRRDEEFDTADYPSFSLGFTQKENFNIVSNEAANVDQVCMFRLYVTLD